MSLVLITYDLKEEPFIHTVVKQHMIKKLKYRDTSPHNKAPLPNTSLLKEGITPQDAVNELKAAVVHCNGTLERYAACYCAVQKILVGTM